MIQTLNRFTVQSPLIATKEYSRILSAAVVNADFRQKLLSDPLAAIASGYSGETFELNTSQQDRIARIQACSLADFAAQLA